MSKPKKPTSEGKKDIVLDDTFAHVHATIKRLVKEGHGKTEAYVLAHESLLYNYLIGLRATGARWEDIVERVRDAYDSMISSETNGNAPGGDA